MPNPYESAIRAFADGRISTENALGVIAYINGLPPLVCALAERLVRDGRAFTEDFPSHPACGELAIQLGLDIARSMQGRIGDLQTTFRRVHAADLRRLENPRPQEWKWDVSRQG
jgi:hypothetical protein